jgi:putative transposase
MARSNHTEAQIIGARKQLEAGRKAEDVAREVGVSKHTIYAWKAKYGGMDVNEAQEAKQLRDENARLKKLVVDLSLDKEMLKAVIAKNGWSLVDQRADANWLRSQYAESQRRVCGLMGMAVASYATRRHAAMSRCARSWWSWHGLNRASGICGYVLLGRSGEQVIHKRVHRVYREAGLMIRRKKRKHCVREGKPLLVRTSANQECALDFLHDAVECGRAIRVLSVVYAHTQECLALEVDTSFCQLESTRVLEQIVGERGVPQAIRCNNGPELTSPAFSGVVRGAADRVAAHSDGQADAECAGGKLSRTATGWVLDSELVSEPVRRTAEDRSVANGAQRRPSA